MQVQYEKAGPCVAKVTFQVPRDDFEKEVKKALKHLGRGTRMKGFRPGKVPMSVLEKGYGEQVRKDAMQHFVNVAYQQAVKENDLKPIGVERIAADQLAVSDNGDFGHEFEISLRPEIELGQYKSLEIESQLAPVMDEEIEAAIEDVRRQRAKPEPAGDEGLPEDGMVLCKVRWVVDDETILERDGLRLLPVDPIPGVDADAYKAALVGAKDGEERELELTIPEEFEKEELRGKQGTCHMTVTQAFQIEMPTDEELFQLFEVEDEDGLKSTVREKIGEAKEQQEAQRIEAELMSRIVDTHPMDLPQRMLEEQAEARLQQLKAQLEGQGLEGEALESELDQNRDKAREAAEKGLRSLFLIQQIAEDESLIVTREDMFTEFDSIAARNQSTRQEVQKYYEENKMIDQMALEILERKVRGFVRENAIVNDPN